MPMRLPLWIAAVCIGICVANAAPISAARAQAPATADEVAASEAKMHVATVAIDAAATRLFHDAGERYTSPRVIGHQGAINSACSPQERQRRNMAVIFPIAHEWGHELQFMMGLDHAKFNTSEHDADCLAGVLIAASRRGASLSSQELTDAEYTMQSRAASEPAVDAAATDGVALVRADLVDADRDDG